MNERFPMQLATALVRQSMIFTPLQKFIDCPPDYEFLDPSTPNPWMEVPAALDDEYQTIMA